MILFFHYQEEIGLDPSLCFYHNPILLIILDTKLQNHLHRFLELFHYNMDSLNLSYDY